MPAQVKRELTQQSPETAETLEDLAFALGMERTRLYRLRQDFPGAPEMHEDGAFWVDEWRQWLAEIVGFDKEESAEAKLARLERVKAQARREAAQAEREELKLKKERREVVTIDEHLAALKIPVAAAHAALDECEGQLLLILQDAAAKDRVRAIFGAARNGFAALLAAEIKRAENAG